MAGKQLTVSASALGDYLKCPRCYWLDKAHGVAKPRGAFPTLPGGVDKILKVRYDGYRATVGGRPPEFENVTGGRLYPTQERIDAWRSWRTTDLKIDVGGALVRAELDDLVVEPNGSVSPIDYKTRGYAFKPGADPFQYYAHQLNVYALILERRGMKTSGRAYLVYWWPVLGGDATAIMFEATVYATTTDLLLAEQQLQEAAACAQSAEPPESSDACEMCAYLAQRAAIGKAIARG